MSSETLVVVPFETSRHVMRHPDDPRFSQPAEGSPAQRLHGQGDLSLRLKNGSAQDDAIDGDESKVEIRGNRVENPRR